jgi:hypothetical protein
MVLANGTILALDAFRDRAIAKAGFCACKCESLDPAAQVVRLLRIF